jgi:GntR family transcriptional regulator/MocR family aminotransferase
MLPLINRQARNPIFHQLYTFFVTEIHTRRLKPDQQMPSIRSLADTLGVSVNTVRAAYELLVQEGYLNALARRGYVVQKIDKIFFQTPEPHQAPPPVSSTGKLRYNLSEAQVAYPEFPMKSWRKMVNLAHDHLPHSIHDYETQSGLREELAHYLYQARGVKTKPQNIFITAGTFNSMSLVAYLLMPLCQTLWFENPGYTEGRQALEHAGLNMKSIAIGKNGVDLTALPEKARQAVYITPSHQFPTGVVMPVSQRIQLLRWAFRNRAYILEDDYDSEFCYRLKPIPSLQSLDQQGRVIYLGTFSKTLLPYLRVSYVVIPDSLLDEKPIPDFMRWNVSYMTQKTLALFMEHGFWERHLRRMRKLYKEKYYFTEARLRSLLSRHVSYAVSHSGLYFYLTLRSPRNMSWLKKKMSEAKIHLSIQQPSDHHKNTRCSFFFGFADLSLQQIERALLILKSVLEDKT